MRRLIQNTRTQRIELRQPPIERPANADARMADALARGVIAKLRASGREPTAPEVVKQVRGLLDENGRRLSPVDLERLTAAALKPGGKP